ncbi:MAG: hypothetical protein FJ297_11475 [Planctomycetes bacterium]|nr:hypothetical protein [Planctomycetota bacterium]
MTEPSASTTIRLGELAVTRSGDKGNHVNLGVIARRPESYAFLVRELTADRILAHFASSGTDRVERFELPNVQALNFMLYNALDGGAGRSLRSDTQGKLFGTAAQELRLPRGTDPPGAASG